MNLSLNSAAIPTIKVVHVFNLPNGTKTFGTLFLPKGTEIVGKKLFVQETTPKTPQEIHSRNRKTYRRILKYRNQASSCSQ